MDINIVYQRPVTGLSYTHTHTHDELQRCMSTVYRGSIHSSETEYRTAGVDSACIYQLGLYVQEDGV